MPEILNLTRYAARSAIRLYFEPLFMLFQAIGHYVNNLPRGKTASISPVVPKAILHSIEFTPEDIDAGLVTLSYFVKILRKKYHGAGVKVGIEKEGSMIRMKIESRDGALLELVEQNLREYGLVVTGQVLQEESMSDTYQLAELSQQLKLAHLQLRLERDTSQQLKHYSEKRIEELERQVKDLNKLIDNHLRYADVQYERLLASQEALERRGAMEFEGEIVRALEVIGRNEPNLLERLKEHVYGALSSGTGTKIYGILVRLFEGLPK